MKENPGSVLILMCSMIAEDDLKNLREVIRHGEVVCLKQEVGEKFG